MTGTSPKKEKQICTSQAESQLYKFINYWVMDKDITLCTIIKFLLGTVDVFFNSYRVEENAEILSTGNLFTSFFPKQNVDIIISKKIRLQNMAF